MKHQKRIERIEQAHARRNHGTRKPFNHRVIELLCVRGRELTAEEKAFLAEYENDDTRLFERRIVELLQRTRQNETHQAA